MKQWAVILAASAVHAAFSQLGCFPKQLVQGLDQGSYMYQLKGWCTDQCKGLAMAALIDGDTCWCGDNLPDLLSKVSSLNCDIKCQGFPSDNCGGQEYFMVFVDSLVETLAQQKETSTEVSTRASTTTALPTTSSTNSDGNESKETSHTEKETLNTDEKTTSDDKTTSLTLSLLTLSPVTTVVSTITADGTKSATVIFKTIFNLATPTADSTAASSLDIPTGEHKNKGISGGAIAGAVVGLVLGAAALAGLVFFGLWYKRRRDDDDLDFEDQFTLLGPEKVPPPAPSAPNPFLLAGGYNFAQNADGAATTNSLDSSNNHLRATLHGFVLVGDHLMTLDPEYHAYDDRAFRPQAPEPVLTRKLLNGSLPEMVARQPGSLKVVNN